MLREGEGFGRSGGPVMQDMHKHRCPAPPHQEFPWGSRPILAGRDSPLLSLNSRWEFDTACLIFSWCLSCPDARGDCWLVQGKELQLESLRLRELSPTTDRAQASSEGRLEPWGLPAVTQSAGLGW